MGIKFSDLDPQLQENIVPSLRPFFDQIYFDNRKNWIIVIHYGPIEHIESFSSIQMELYEEYDLHEREEMFEVKKLRLFLDGVYLYIIKTFKEIELVCDAYEEHYVSIR